MTTASVTESRATLQYAMKCAPNAWSSTVVLRNSLGLIGDHYAAVHTDLAEFEAQVQGE
jgi:hypothetical protein